MHECGFLGFMACSLLHMSCTICIDYFWPRTRESCETEKDKSFRSKRLTRFLCNIVFFAFSLYFFFRHNRYCEPYIYSWYSFFEYLVVFTNICYHSIIRAEWDQEAGLIQFFY
jgi:hypothetical protein